MTLHLSAKSQLLEPGAGMIWTMIQMMNRSVRHGDRQGILFRISCFLHADHNVLTIIPFYVSLFFNRCCRSRIQEEEKRMVVRKEDRRLEEIDAVSVLFIRFIHFLHNPLSYLIVIPFQFQMQKVASITNTFLKIKDWSNVVSLKILCVPTFPSTNSLHLGDLRATPHNPPLVCQSSELASLLLFIKKNSSVLEKVSTTDIDQSKCTIWSLQGTIGVALACAFTLSLQCFFRLGSPLLSSNWSSGWRSVNLKSRLIGS